MYLYYGMIIVAAALFASQFLFNQKFQQQCGTTWSATMTFTIYTNAAATLIMLAINRFHLEFTLFSLGMALLSATAGILYTYASMKAFSVVNLAVYSMFAMLGGMMLPFLYGILFENEPVTVPKVLCGGLIVAALLNTVAGEMDIKKGWKYYLSVFVLNGMTGVISTIHQSAGDLSVDSGSFSVWIRIVPLVICLGIQLVSEKKIARIPSKIVPYTVGYAAFCGIGNLFLLIALEYLPASVQYPVVTGGTMIFSTIISAVRKEKITKRTIVSAALALLATIFIIL